MSFKDFNMNMDDYNKQLSDLETNKEETKKEYKDPTDGEYECALVSLELGTNKAGDKLMLKGSFKILDGEFKNQRLWINKVLTGTRNDAGCVRACTAFLNSLVAGSVLQQERGAGVTQAVEREVFRQACVLAVALDELAYCVGVERPAVLSREKEAVWLPQRVSHGLQADGPYLCLNERNNRLRQAHSAPAVFCFGACTNLTAAFNTQVGLPNGERAPLQVHVLVA